MDVTQLTQHLTATITAIGALGTAAFGLLEAIKPVPLLGTWINGIGFGGIRKTVSSLTPNEANGKAPVNALPSAKVMDSLEANWRNGTDLASQKAIAKSLIKLRLSPGTAPALATATNVDSTQLVAVATSMVSGAALTQPQSDANSRFDLIVTAMLDECYQRADDDYRNLTRMLAALIAVLLALAAGWILNIATPAAGSAPLLLRSFWSFLCSQNLGPAILAGLLATPLAPIAKDLSTALSTAVNTMQLVKKP